MQKTFNQLFSKQESTQTSGSISVEDKAQFRESKLESELLKSKHCSFDGSRKFDQLQAMFEKILLNHTFCGSHRSLSLSSSIANEIAVTRINIPIQMMKATKQNRFCRLERKKQNPLYFTVLAKVMLSPENEYKADIAGTMLNRVTSSDRFSTGRAKTNNAFESCQIWNQNIHKVSQNKLNFFSTKNRSEGPFMFINSRFNTSNSVKRSILWNSCFSKRIILNQTFSWKKTQMFWSDSHLN